MKKELLEGLTDEQVEKLNSCKSSEEMLELAKQEGVELNEEQLEAVSGGGACGNLNNCPHCGSENIYKDNNPDGSAFYVCRNCKKTFTWREATEAHPA